LGDHRHNLGACVDAVRQAEADGADLVVLPECALTGYMFGDGAAARQGALARDDEIVRAFAREVRGVGMHAVVGLLETDGDALFNTAVLFGPDGEVGYYRKAHIPCLGVDRFVRRGQVAGPVLDTPVGRIGLSICYDVRFPEAARALALAGVEVIAQPANIGVGAPELTLDCLAVARALENSVYLAVANRCDTEQGVEFCGRSRIVTPDGTVAADAGDRPGVAVTEVDLRDARVKRRELRSQGSHIVVDFFGDRRPELYGDLTMPAAGQPSVPSSVAGDDTTLARRSST